jgi:hypothetical protein
MEPSLLSGLVLYFEVFRSGTDESSDWAEQAEALGAEVSAKLVKKVTHVVYKEGNKSTYDRAVAMNIPIVRPSWIFDSGSQGARQPEADYVPREPLTDIRVKRCRLDDQLTPPDKKRKVEETDPSAKRRYLTKVLQFDCESVFLTQWDDSQERKCSQIPDVQFTREILHATCIIVSSSKPSLEVTYARAKGLSLVTPSWLKDSAAALTKLSFEGYRWSEPHELNRELFKNYTFVFVDKVHYQAELAEIIQLLGGSVTANLRSADKIILDSDRTTIQLDIAAYVQRIKSSWIVDAVALNRHPE